MTVQSETTAAAQLIDGKQIAQQVRDEVGSAVAKRLAAGKSKPTLAAVLVVRSGVAVVRLPRLDRFSHAFAGLAVLVCGMLVKFGL